MKECIICTDSIQQKDCIALTCAHIYHTYCVLNLIKKRIRKCPICRARITWTKDQLIRHNILYKE